MANDTAHFDDAADYERFMGRWSRATGSIFLGWLALPPDMRWLDVGCGSGAFTALVHDACAPAMMSAIDPAPAQIAYVSRLSIAQRTDFRVADAQALPFPDATFDIVVSALVLNFIPDRIRGLEEMRRVARSGGVVAGYVWDFAADRGPNQPLRAGMLQVGADIRPPPGAEGTSLAALMSSFEQAGFKDLEARAIDVSLDFANFDEYLRAQTPRLHPITKTIAALPEGDRVRLLDLIRQELKTRSDGSVACWARANAIKARVPD
jgi:SAM-dependent methyltransferase